MRRFLRWLRGVLGTAAVWAFGFGAVGVVAIGMSGYGLLGMLTAFLPTPIRGENGQRNSGLDPNRLP